MPLGDSITHGFGSSGADGGGAQHEGGYRIELFRQAVTNTKNITFVGSLANGPTTIANKPFPRNHEGHGGFPIAGITAVIRPAGRAPLLTTYKPHIVLLKIGTNDINGNNDLANAPARLATLIDAITTDDPSALVVVSSIVPILNDNTNAAVKTYNAAIPGVVSKAAAAGKHVRFIDTYAAYVRDANWKTKLMFDNLHPNDAGYVVLGQMWYEEIKGFLPRAP
jgi:lysophospholipase L1-like esterase